MKSPEPKLGASSFACPHCGAHAQQNWFRVFGMPFLDDARPALQDKGVLDNVRGDKYTPDHIKSGLINYFQRILNKEVFISSMGEGIYCDNEAKNLFISKCFSCNSFSIWAADRIIYPEYEFFLEPNSDLPEDVIVDFREAASILGRSPRGAAALLRLAIQKICIFLGEGGRDLNKDIASLVKKGLDPRVEAALDVVRVIGNNAVHPGELDVGDDVDTVHRLFNLVNIIADALISQPKQIEELYAKLPTGAREGIQKRSRHSRDGAQTKE